MHLQIETYNKTETQLTTTKLCKYLMGNTVFFKYVPMVCQVRVRSSNSGQEMIGISATKRIYFWVD